MLQGLMSRGPWLTGPWAPQRCVFVDFPGSLACRPRAPHKGVYLLTSRGPWLAGPRAPHKCVCFLTSRGPWRTGPRPSHKCAYLLTSQRPWPTGCRAPRKCVYLLTPRGPWRTVQSDPDRNHCTKFRAGTVGTTTENVYAKAPAGVSKI